MLSQSLIAQIIITSISCITFPSVCYLFWKLRYHFIIHARHPFLTFISALIMHLINVVSVINQLLVETYGERDVNLFISNITHSGSYLAVAVIVYRLLLVYDDWIQSNYRYEHRIDIINNTFHLVSSDFSSIQKYSCCSSLSCKKRATHKFIGYFLVFQFIFFVVTSYWEQLKMIRYANWIIFTIVAAILLFKARKIKDNLSCAYEIYLVILLIFVHLITTIVFSFFVSIGWVYFISIALSSVSLQTNRFRINK